jgi:hypothetical protein
MGSFVKTSCLLAAAIFVFAVGTARAGEVDVKVPFPFLVHDRVLPAGEYHLESDALDPSIIMIRGEKGTRTAVAVLTMPADGHDPAGDKPALMFTRHETQYRLTDIWESNSEGREIAGK